VFGDDSRVSSQSFGHHEDVVRKIFTPGYGTLKARSLLNPQYRKLFTDDIILRILWYLGAEKDFREFPMKEAELAARICHLASGRTTRLDADKVTKSWNSETANLQAHLLTKAQLNACKRWYLGGPHIDNAANTRLFPQELWQAAAFQKTFGKMAVLCCKEVSPVEYTMAALFAVVSANLGVLVAPRDKETLRNQYFDDFGFFEQLVARLRTPTENSDTLRVVFDLKPGLERYWANEALKTLKKAFKWLYEAAIFNDGDSDLLHLSTSPLHSFGMALGVSKTDLRKDLEANVYRKYCVCQTGELGVMLACERNGGCPHGEWFHHACVLPKGSAEPENFFCRQCREDLGMHEWQPVRVIKKRRALRQEDELESSESMEEEVEPREPGKRQRKPRQIVDM